MLLRPIPSIPLGYEEVDFRRIVRRRSMSGIVDRGNFAPPFEFS